MFPDVNLCADDASARREDERFEDEGRRFERQNLGFNRFDPLPVGVEVVHPDLRGIYCAGGGMEGVIAALREVRAPQQVALVVNELTPESRKALADRYVTMVIGTPLTRLCADLFDLAGQARAQSPSLVPGQHFLQPDLFLPESI